MDISLFWMVVFLVVNAVGFYVNGEMWISMAGEIILGVIGFVALMVIFVGPFLAVGFLIFEKVKP